PGYRPTRPGGALIDLEAARKRAKTRKNSNRENAKYPARGTFRVLFLFGSSAILLSMYGCRSGRVAATAVAPVSASASSPVRFSDVAELLGVRFKHTNGESGRLYLAETMGAGGAFLDYDGDGRLDLFLVNSSRLPGFKSKGSFYPALYRQRSDGTFEDVTKRAGLTVD